MIKNFGFVLVNLLSMILAIGAYSQACPGNSVSVTLSNITNNPAANTIEFDVNITNTGTTVIKLASLSGAVIHNGGFATAGSFTVVTHPAGADFPTLNNIAATAYTASSSQMRWTNNPVLEPAAANLPAGLLRKFARFRFVRSGSNFPPDFVVSLTFAEYVATGVTAVNPNVYCNGNPNSTPLANGAFPTNNGYLIVGGPYTTTLNSSCATTGTYTQTPVTCFGGSNGTATITLANNIPASPNATYSLDSGTPVAVTLNASGAFTISGLTAGNHTLTVTGSGSCTTPISVPLTIGGPATALTNSTTITNCDSYLWSVTGLSYTTSGVYTGTSTNGSGCPVAETLNLTINNSTSGTTTVAACNTYTWALPLGTGLTYTTSQPGITNVTTNAAGCPHTQTLNLTINTTTSGTTNATACDTYTWAAPLGNGLTYTTSQTGVTFVSTNGAGCSNTQTLNLTINNSTTGTTTASACDTYTWASPLGNGLTYTSGVSGLTFVSTNAAGCPNTQTLNLTLNNSTTGTTTAAACNTYTWALPLGTGLTYTTSQPGITNVTTNAAGCPHTQTLNLTINNSTTGTTTATACDTYTWAAPLGNGLTYTTSQTGVTFVSTNAAGCPHTQTLNLTINNSSTGITTATACDTYTWATPLGNGLTYTSSVSGLNNITTNAVGCPHTQTLNLTINNSTAGTTNASACSTYTWAAPLGNGLTYTTSQAGVTFVSTNAAGCPNTQTLNLTIGSTSGTTTATACDTYTWTAPLGNGLTYTTSQTGITFVSTNAAGCPHTQTLNLTINNSTTGTTTATACDTYTWASPLGNGLTYTSSQSGVIFVSTNAAGCPNTQTLNLTINNSTSATTTAAACDTYTWALPLGNGITYNSSVAGATNITTNAAGCPHTQTLNLTITNSTSGTTTATACNTYTWALPLGNGQTYTTSQTGITNVTTNAAGCPHTQTLNLTINTSTTGTTTATSCNSYTWLPALGNGTTYTTSQTGITNVSTNANGCPHTQTLNLTINYSTNATSTVAACNTYTWAGPLGNGQTYINSAIVNNVTTNAAGCLHTQTLVLTIKRNTAGTTNAIACNSYTWAAPRGNGQTYTTSQTGITNVSTNAAGCPHTQTLNLTINNSTTNTTTATACDSYTWALPLGNGQTYTSSVSGVTHVSTNTAGCAHTETLNLTVNNSTVNSTYVVACDTYTWAAPLGNGLTYIANTTAINQSINAAGCTHIERLRLIIRRSTSATTNAVGCGSYTWALPLGNGQTYTTSQTGITNVTTNTAGCTNTQTLNLVINNNTTGTTTATTCNSYTWAAPLGNGFTYTASQSGVTHVSYLPGGCQHVETLNLTINSGTSGTTVATGCGSYTWAAPLGNGQTYTANTTATNVTTNAAGCPHVQTLNLTIGQSTTYGNATVTAQNTYTWAANGVTYTTSGVYTFTSVNSSGCQNVATLNLTIITGSTWYADADGDGYGNPSTAIFASTQPIGYVAIGTDCDDTRAAVNPGAVEVCYDGLDNDCNGIIDNVGMAGGCIPITTSLQAIHCGSTITNLSTIIKAYYVVGAQGYRFRVRNLTNNSVQIKDRPTNTFTFSSLIGINIGTSYQVDVALLLNGVWQPFYGSPCIINTASAVSTIGAQCGTTLNSMNQWVYATYYSTATGYRFRVTNTSTSAVQTLTTSLNRFYFNQLPNHNFGTTYFVEVALRNTDGTYLPYGPGCNITTPPSAREIEDTPTDDTSASPTSSVQFKAVAYPNPFAENFKLNIITSDDSTIQIRVYDMLGKQLENRNVEVNEMQNLQVGASYPSGVYNVIVTQGNITQTIRVIKR